MKHISFHFKKKQAFLHFNINDKMIKPMEEFIISVLKIVGSYINFTI